MMAIARYWDLSVLYVYAFSWHCMLPVRSIRVNFTAGHDLIRLAQRQRVGDLPQLVHHLLPRDNRIRRPEKLAGRTLIMMKGLLKKCFPSSPFMCCREVAKPKRIP